MWNEKNVQLKGDGGARTATDADSARKGKMRKSKKGKSSESSKRASSNEQKDAKRDKEKNRSGSAMTNTKKEWCE